MTDMMRYRDWCKTIKAGPIRDRLENTVAYDINHLFSKDEFNKVFIDYCGESPIPSIPSPE